MGGLEPRERRTVPTLTRLTMILLHRTYPLKDILGAAADGPQTVQLTCLPASSISVTSLSPT